VASKAQADLVQTDQGRGVHGDDLCGGAVAGYAGGACVSVRIYSGGGTLKGMLRASPLMTTWLWV
jgi:hypothetical protein